MLHPVLVRQELHQLVDHRLGLLTVPSRAGPLGPTLSPTRPAPATSRRTAWSISLCPAAS